MSDFWQAAAGWWGQAAVAGGGVLLVARGLLAVVGRPAVRAAVAGWGVRGAVAAAGLCLLPAWLTVPFPSRPAPPAAAAAPAFVDAGGFVLIPAEPTAPAPEPASPEPPAGGDIDPVPWLVGGYLAVAGGLLAHLAVGCVGVWRLRRASAPAPARVADVAADLTNGRRPAVRVSDRVATPVCFGVVRPTVVLPRRLADGAPEAELRWVLAHEFDHLGRGDPATAVWAAVCRAVFFYVPWLAAVRRELAVAHEHLADAAAVAAGGRPADYAEFLVRLSADHSYTRLPVPAASAGRRGSDLRRRVTMLVDTTDRVDPRCPRGWAAGAAGGLLAAAVLLSGVGLRTAAADDPPEPPAPPAAPEPPAPHRPSADEVDRALAELADQPADGRTVANYTERMMAAARALAEAQLRKAGPDDLRRLRQQVSDLSLRNALAMSRAAAAKHGGVPPGRPQVFTLPGLSYAHGPDGRLTPEQLGQVERMRADALRSLAAAPPAAREFALRTLDQTLLKLHRPIARPRLGVSADPVPDVLRAQLDLPPGVGVVVTDVADGSPAAAAGVRPNDVLVKFAGSDVADGPGRFAAQAAAAAAGRARIELVRKGKRQTLVVDLPAPAPPAKPDRAFELEVHMPDGPAAARVAFDALDTHMLGDEFDIRARAGGVEYKLSGRVKGGKAELSELRVGGRPYTRLADVPAEHRAAVGQLAGMVGP